MELKCYMGMHEPGGENLLAALSKGNRRIITEAEAKAIVRAMEKEHAAVKIMAKIIAEAKSDG